MQNNVVDFPIVKVYDELTGSSYYHDTRLEDFMITYVNDSGVNVTGTIPAKNKHDAFRRWVKTYPENRVVVNVLSWEDFGFMAWTT